MSEKKSLHHVEGAVHHAAAGGVWSGWTTGLVILATAMVCGGVGIKLLGGGSKETSAPSPASPSGQSQEKGKSALAPQGFLPEGFPSPTGTESETGSSPTLSGEAQDPLLSPALLRGGVGFFVGFALGFVLRSLYKLSLAFMGLLFLVLFGLSYINFITVHWDTIQTQFDQWGITLQRQFENFKTFVLGALPSAGLTAVGLLAGFKRK
jgi:uncharacterized membrane protein (Fun14 family)